MFPLFLWTSDKAYVLRFDKGPLPRLVKIHPVPLTPRKCMYREFIPVVSLTGQELATFAHAQVCSFYINRDKSCANSRQLCRLTAETWAIVIKTFTLTNASDSKGGSFNGSTFFSLSFVSFTSLVATSKNKKTQQFYEY